MKLMDIIREQKFPSQLTDKPTSDYLGKGGSFERSLYGGVGVEQYAKRLAIKKPDNIKKVRLIFPKAKWEEIALNFLERLGVVTGVFTTLNSAINFVKDLTNKGVKTDEFVIGSHGEAGTLLSTKTSQNTHFNNEFLNNFKNIVHPGTKVFFTACNGADYLDSLKDAAERLGVGSYGSAGIYNYITNSSESGYYWCSSAPFEPPTVKQIEPYTFDKFGYIYLSTLVDGGSWDASKKLPVVVKMKDSVFNQKFSPISFDATLTETKDATYSLVRKDKTLVKYSIEIRWHISRVTGRSYSDPKSAWNKKEKEMDRIGKSMDDYILDKIKSNEITVEVNLNGQNTNIKSLKPITISGKVTNEFLLAKGLCKKVSKPPINWV